MSVPPSLLAPVGLAPGDHVAWPVEGPGRVRDALLPYLNEGAARGERLFFIRGGDAESEFLAGLPECWKLLQDGRLRIQSCEEAYQQLAGDVWEQAEHFRREAGQALAGGFTGIRVWADVTPLARDDAMLERLLDYETAVEKTFRECPATAVCALDITQAGEQWTRLASRHRLHGEWGETPALSLDLYDNVVRLAGDVAFADIEELQGVLRSVERTTTGPLVLDLAEVEFLDVAGTRALARFVQELTAAGRSVELVGAHGVPARLLALFNFPWAVRP